MRTAEYDKVYLRDFIIFSSDFHPALLLRFHDLQELPSRSLIDVHYPLSVSEMSIKNIADNPKHISTLVYN